MTKTSLLLLAAALSLAGSAVQAAHSKMDAAYDAVVQAPLSAVALLGERMFFDSALSASGKQSCATCHDPAQAFAPANDRAVQLGGPDLKTPGIRATPSLTYLWMTPPFSIGPESTREVEPAPGSSPPDAVSAPNVVARAGSKAGGAAAVLTPQGGFFWDGRADTLQEQALGPLLSPFEMANRSPTEIHEKLRRAPYAADFLQLFGPAVFEDPVATLAEAEFALARFQIEDRRFHAYTSKYDAYLRGQTSLSAAEQRGLQLFEDPAKGNCAACHLDRPGRDGAPPAFTDYEFEALGAPRNPAIPANADPAWFDLGICGPLRDDAYAGQPTNCGLFKTPTLRNAAMRRVFFHNGVYRDLHEVVRFYVNRASRPEKIYPRRSDGGLALYDDLPEQYRANIDKVDAPFDAKPGAPPALTEAEINDVVAFLATLSDEDQPPS